MSLSDVLKCHYPTCSDNLRKLERDTPVKPEYDEEGKPEYDEEGKPEYDNVILSKYLPVVILSLTVIKKNC